MKSFSIQTPKGERIIGYDQPSFIVAEMSGNHHHDYNKAVEIIKAAAASGADAIKIQTYTPDTMTIDSDKEWFVVKGKNQPATWQGQKLYDLYKIAYTSWEWDKKLKKVAEDLGLTFFSTPFDPTAVDFLEKLNVPCYKISSYESTDLILLRAVAQTKKPVIISVGFASRDEVDFAIETLRKYGSTDIAVLYCVTAYSSEPNIDEMHLRTMLDIRDRYDVVCGFSDNNAGVDIPFVSAIAGASIIEKHLMINRTEGGPDARFSVEPNEFKLMVDNIRRAERMMGTVHYGCQSEKEKEKENTIFRRSLFVIADMTKGEHFSSSNLRSIRPSAGLPTKYYDEVIGKTATRDIERGTPLSWDLVER